MKKTLTFLSEVLTFFVLGPPLLAFPFRDNCKNDSPQDGAVSGLVHFRTDELRLVAGGFGIKRYDAIKYKEAIYA